MRNRFGRMHLEFGGGTGDKLFAAGLIAIIVLALGLTIWTFVDEGGSTTTGNEETRFKCVDCGHEFTLTEEEYDDVMMQAEESGSPYGMMVLDCRNPDCPGPESKALRMSRCPACRKHYLSPETVDTFYGQGYGRRGEVSEDVCPHCDTNIREWYRKKFKK